MSELTELEQRRNRRDALLDEMFRLEHNLGGWCLPPNERGRTMAAFVGLYFGNEYRIRELEQEQGR